ncbi:MAG: penicillin acylase family protein [candidate division KSB1 bacterium]|nr:penicillin acylase family protein [candidate division KSB1 bacterium]MDZ7369377.1 penicillin acylase family protein [candidate division KSB1 bacterium]MDZ7403213.1 penicillin acylase family protein [candidate division KSB1 bacterium]
MPKILKLLLPAILLGGYLFFIHRPFNRLPPPAKFFDPLRGFLQPAAGFTHASSLEMTMPALKGSVKILFDRRGVPHVFAERAEDLPVAVGYLHARERLFQMEMIVRSVRGRLSEVIGAVALPSDRFFLENGFRDAADRAMAAADRSHPAYHALEKYTAGINHFIAQLSPADYPLEYKLLNFSPSHWEPQNSAYLLKYMARELSWHSSELAFDRMRRDFAPEILQELFPVENACPAPIYPGLFRDVRSSSLRSLSPEYPNGLCLKAPRQNNKFDDRNAAESLLLGSNNWAIGAAKSASGHAILANDPHLGHSLPNYWYEVDLHAPGLEVYGMTLPGAPDVILGFNRHIAWGATNCGWDVLDYYKIDVDIVKQTALIEGRNEPLQISAEKIPVKDHAPEEIKIRWSRLGPVVQRDGVDYAMRWTGHLSGGEWRVFYDLNRARNFSDFTAALKNYGAPAQNFAYVDRAGNVGMYSAGLMPLKTAARSFGAGDASDPAQAWPGSPRADQILSELPSKGFVPFEELPHVFNPPEGFVQSANQKPTPDNHPVFYDWNFEAPYRGMRIHELLSAKPKISIDDMKAAQLDVHSVVARMLTPVILAAFAQDNRANATMAAALDSLRGWDFNFYTHRVAPTIYHSFWEMFKEDIWAKHFQTADGKSYMYPPHRVLLALVTEQPDSKWFDNPKTPVTENLHARVREIFAASVTSLYDEFGGDLSAWRYEKYHKVYADHLLRLPGFGIEPAPRDGEDFTLNVAGGREVTHGPSMRLIVEMGEPIRGYIVNFGGQSGHPGAPHYQDQIDEWLAGKYFPIRFASNPQDIPQEEIEETVYLKPQR